MNKLNTRAISNLGLTMGGIAIVLFLIQVILQGGWIMSAVMGLGSIIVMILLPIYFVRRERERLGGVMSFGQIFGLVFIGLLIGGIISSAFTLLYVKFIDPEYVDRLVYSTLESTQSMMEGSMSDAQIGEILAETERKMVDGFSTWGILKSLLIGIAVYAAYAVILGFALRREPQSPPDVLTETTSEV